MSSALDPSRDIKRSRGFVYRARVMGSEGQILVLFDDGVQGLMIGTAPDHPIVPNQYLPAVLNRYAYMEEEEQAEFRRRCMRDTLIYETDKNGPKQYSEHDFPLTPERPIGSLEGEERPSSETEERGCPRNPDTRGSET